MMISLNESTGVEEKIMHFITRASLSGDQKVSRFLECNGSFLYESPQRMVLPLGRVIDRIPSLIPFG